MAKTFQPAMLQAARPISCGQRPGGTRNAWPEKRAMANSPSEASTMQSPRKISRGMSVITSFMIGQLKPQPSDSNASRMKPARGKREVGMARVSHGESTITIGR
jgi:hypothetical protein